MDERILTKIKKLLALAKSTRNEHEAASALSKAQKMMQEYQLSETDVALHEISEQYTKRANAANKQPRWATMLANTVATAFGVDHLLSWHRGVGETVVFIGPTDRVTIGVYCYEVLAPQLVKARKAYLASLDKRLKTATKTNRADLFAEGWIMAVRRKVEALVPTEDEQNLVQLYMEKHYPELETVKTRAAKEKKRDLTGYFEGSAQGRNVKLNAGVAGAAQAQISQKN